MDLKIVFSAAIPSFIFELFAVCELSGCLQCGQSTADEALREHGFKRRGNEIRLDAHVHEAGQCAGASLVCNVEKNRWPVSDACTAICAVSASRISPMRSRPVVAQNRTQPARESEAGFFVDLNLVHALS